MRTEANKMHKSIPLRKQETHSASLMTDLGLESCRKERGIVFHADMLCLTSKYLSQVIYKCSAALHRNGFRKW